MILSDIDSNFFAHLTCTYDIIDNRITFTRIANILLLKYVAKKNNQWNNEYVYDHDK